MSRYELPVVTVGVAGYGNPMKVRMGGKAIGSPHDLLHERDFHAELALDNLPVAHVQRPVNPPERAEVGRVGEELHARASARGVEAQLAETADGRVRVEELDLQRTHR